MRRNLLCVAAAVAFLATSLPGQEGAGGLKPGERLPGPFHVYPATGEYSGRLHCLVCQYGLEPALMVFTREIPDPERPLGRLLKLVDGLLSKYGAVKAGAFVVVLGSEDIKEEKKYDERQAMLAKLADAAKVMGTRHVVYSLDAAPGPKGYNLDPAHSDVVVFYHRQKVQTNHSYGAGGVADADVSKIVAEVDKTVSELERLARPGRPRKAK